MPNTPNRNAVALLASMVFAAVPGMASAQGIPGGSAGHKFVVKNSTGYTSASDLGKIGEVVCVKAGSDEELKIADHYDSLGTFYAVAVFGSDEDILAAFDEGRCEVVLVAQNSVSEFVGNLTAPNEHTVLAEIIE
ncbi:MAG: hypothetical protein JJ911_04250 [Rhizobiaceae bacterium]|nr:hypothetical protein [Rhizobiaceae bacterium]